MCPSSLRVDTIRCVHIASMTSHYNSVQTAVAGRLRRNRGRVAKHHTVILQSEGGLFQLRGPKIGLLIGRSGRRLGVCCVYYPRGPWEAAAIMYPNIVTQGTGSNASGTDGFELGNVS